MMHGTARISVSLVQSRTIAGSCRQAVMSPVTEAIISPTSGQRTSTDSTITTAYAVL